MKTIKFKELGLSTAVLSNLDKAGFSKCSPIQHQAIPVVLLKRDVLGIAKTGSGKTLSYTLPILDLLQVGKPNENREIEALVMVPTRELAIQVGEVFKEYSAGLPRRIKSLAVFGGVSINPQMQAMNNVNVLIATPGRLLDLIKSNALSISAIRTLVLDEADKMLNAGFEEEMAEIFALLPQRRQTLLFSATLTDKVEKIKANLLRTPVLVKVEESTDSDELENIKQSAYYVRNDQKGSLLRHLLKEKIDGQVLIFASSVKQVNNIENKLFKHKIAADVIHSKCSQSERKLVMEKFKSGELKVLIATDLLARGIDVEALPYVVNYELPRSPKDYVHRIGRTGRAGKVGEAISMVSPDEEQHFKVIQKKMNKWVDRVNVDEIDLCK